VRVRRSRVWVLSFCALGFALLALPDAQAQRSAHIGVIVAPQLDRAEALPPWQDYADALVAELSASEGFSVALLYESSPLVRSREVQFPAIGDPRGWPTLEPVLAELAKQIQLDYILVTCLGPPAAEHDNAVASAQGLVVVRGDGGHRIVFNVTQAATNRAKIAAIAADGMAKRVASAIRSKLPSPSDGPQEIAVPVETAPGPAEREGDRGTAEPAPTGTPAEAPEVVTEQTPADLAALEAVEAAFKRGDYDAAAVALRKAFEEQGPSGELYLWQARISLAQHREDDALRDLGKAVEASPDLLEARLRLARLLAKRGLWQDAVQHYRAALALEPDNTQALLGLARVYGDNGHRRKAIELLEGARQSRPQDATILVALADVYAAMNNAQAAEPLYLQAIGLSAPEASASILERLGDLYVKLRRHRDALGCYVKAAELNPSRNAMVRRRYQDVMRAADDTVREELRKTWHVLENYVHNRVGEREQVYARLSAYHQHLEEAIRFAGSVVPPSSLTTEHAQRQLTYSLALEATVAAMAHLDLGGEELLQRAERRRDEALAEFGKLTAGS